MINPKTQNTTYIQIKSQPERYTINIAELAVITVSISQENEGSAPAYTHRQLILHKHNTKLHNGPCFLQAPLTQQRPPPPH